MKIIVLIILTAYLASFIKNIATYGQKNRLFNAIKYRKVLKLSDEKQLNLDDDYDFIKLLVISEHIAFGEKIFSNPSKRIITCANILSNNNAENYQNFLNEEKEKILTKINENKRIIVTKLIVSLIIILFALFLLLH